MGFITPGFNIFAVQSPYLELWAALIGLFVGSFLNVLALRSLAQESLFGFSHCQKCKHRLGLQDLIPVLSYIFLGGRCRFCNEKISWHYPLVEVLTAGLFAAIVNHFAQPIFNSCPDIERMLTTLAMLFFASVLVAVTITDFREKLIPHEITYPSILIGLFFSFAVRHDLLGALAGVGVSYILFDFIAFYGLKFYMSTHPEEEDNPEATALLMDEQLDLALALDLAPTNPEEEEPFEVMGGGDAVLSAVLAAWLGWEKMVAALIIGFMIGAIMGACYLMHELYIQKRLGTVLKPALLGFVLLGGGFALLVGGFSACFGMTTILTNPTVWLLNLIVALGGTTVGVIWSGNAIAKSFPFGPALAVGGIYAVFITNLVDHTFIK